jgi:hypothetical protein
VHHVATNSCDYDPDIQHLPVFAVDPVLVTTKLFSTYANMYMPLSDITHVLVKYQHYLYYPVMAFARFNLYIQSINHALRLSFYGTAGDFIWRQNLQIASLAGFWTWLLALTLSLPSWQSRILFFLPAHIVSGILHVQITLVSNIISFTCVCVYVCMYVCMTVPLFSVYMFLCESFFCYVSFSLCMTFSLPLSLSLCIRMCLSRHNQSHFSMETYTGVTYDDSSNGYLRTQLSTTMDINCNPCMDWFHGVSILVVLSSSVYTNK